MLEKPPQQKESCSDEQLIVMIKKGDSYSMEILIERYQKPVFNFALRLIGDKPNAEDITQETLIKVIKSLPSYKPKNFRSYVYRIASNTAYDKMREQKTAISFDNEFNGEEEDLPGLKEIIPDVSAPQPEQSLIRSETEDLISRMLSRLPYEQRRVFILREFSDLSFKEIAETCGCSLNTVLSRMHYCVKKLKKLLEGKI